MAKASSDRNTIDLFGKSPGRPRTQPLTRKDQLKLNKRAQREKEKAQGLKRLELIVEQDIIDKLDELCELNGIKRAEWLTLQITKSLAKSKTIRPSKKATKAIDTPTNAK
ncbi:MULTISPECIES: LexA regulated protein [Marinomonas]|uniref:LexA regulated protein n=1 Tax=Marinomonas arctica TaxID=383750 RepID=A0A7H1JAB9_9GAMM|nr:MULTISPECIES: LexA regulated protein [Marinomonas]QNT07435.1 LexA regulated protein [Marinomonas arctica]GGN26730.1 LexA regulated protein [Marinomonas arctica]